ncbi:hypothetical protein AALP_AA8G020200 [Arabis alpina]|uniref:F-box domain-containing protein n=1 Tax=Arabis alpina TaxID=50452 RepID=A0A087G4F0_ARAAL|nr:hypothetical protein AALP_AA8G020200 [Arabis alpina]
MAEDNSTAAVINPSHREIKLSKDIISSMPDEILHHILSFLPTEFSLRTSALSKRWRYVWSETPYLSFDCYETDPISVNQTLYYYSADKIKSYHLSISCMADNIDSFIEFAMSRDTEKLSLEFYDALNLNYDFPKFFYNDSSLKQLLVQWGNLIKIPKRIPVSWSSLITLSLSFCKLSADSFVKILSGSPLLESLTLHYCSRLDRLDLKELRKCKRLDIKYSGPMQIVAPHIRFLRLQHAESQWRLVDVSSLTEAKLEIYSCDSSLFNNPENFEVDLFQVMIIKMLEKLQNLKKLTFTGSVILQILSLAVLCGVPFPALKVEALLLETMIVPSVIPGIAKLLQSSPRLKKLKLRVMDPADCNTIPEMNLNSYLGPDQCWKPKHLVIPTSTEPKLVTAVMKFLLENTGDEGSTVERLLPECNWP